MYNYLHYIFESIKKMKVGDLQEFLKNKNPNMEIKIVCDDTERIYDLIGEDKSILETADYLFLEAKRITK